MKKKKIMAVTTSRADYGILYPLLCRLEADDAFELFLAATGTHFSERHGMTAGQILKDGFKIGASVEPASGGDTDHDICLAVSDGLKAFSAVIEKETPDGVLVLGDRYELWPVCMAANIHKVPVIHIHGGETTFGALDENIRHSVTKMSAIHFPSIEQYRKRIIQMGENPERVFAVGALGIDCIKATPLFSREELSGYTGADFSTDTALLTYHPVTLDEYSKAAVQAETVLEAVLETGLSALVTAPNGDAGGRAVIDKIEEYVSRYPERFVFIRNLGQKAYYSAMAYSRVMVGNSSSGIIESASFRLPVVNVGDRQAGRFKPLNVIDCSCGRGPIISAVKRALSEDFRDSIAGLENPYGDGNTAERMAAILKTLDLSDRELIKKKFYDIGI